MFRHFHPVVQVCVERVPCVRAMSEAALWVSKALSYAILVGSLIMQAPQIYKIVQARSAAGITPGSRTWQRPHIARPLRASAEPLRGCSGQPCALRTARGLSSPHIFNMPPPPSFAT